MIEAGIRVDFSKIEWKLRHVDPKIDSDPDVRAWLEIVESRIKQVWKEELE
jgi:hypothetical protein